MDAHKAREERTLKGHEGMRNRDFLGALRQEDRSGKKEHHSRQLKDVIQGEKLDLARSSTDPT